MRRAAAPTAWALVLALALGACCTTLTAAAVPARPSRLHTPLAAGPARKLQRAGLKKVGDDKGMACVGWGPQSGGAEQLLELGFSAARRVSRGSSSRLRHSKLAALMHVASAALSPGMCSMRAAQARQLPKAASAGCGLRALRSFAIALSLQTLP